jgi:hypothetical protein
LDGGIGGRAKRLKDQQHLVAFDELARLLDRLWRTERVVIGNKSDLAAIDAALSVDLAKITRALPALASPFSRLFKPLSSGDPVSPA